MVAKPTADVPDSSTAPVHVRPGVSTIGALQYAAANYVVVIRLVMLDVGHIDNLARRLPSRCGRARSAIDTRQLEFVAQ